ncbi:hypothetical protein AKJ16_DCAP01685 [Drosera capensis]
MIRAFYRACDNLVLGSEFDVIVWRGTCEGDEFVEDEDSGVVLDEGFEDRIAHCFGRDWSRVLLGGMGATQCLGGDAHCLGGLRIRDGKRSNAPEKVEEDDGVRNAAVVVLQNLSSCVLIPQFLKRISFHGPGLSVVDADIALDILRDDEQRFERFALEKEFHISLGRTVPIRVHQIDSMVTMLRQKLLSQKRSDCFSHSHSSFVSDKEQIQAVNHAYRLHNLPEFDENPWPHISLVWASGDVRDSLLRAVADETKKCADAAGSLQKRIFTVKFSGIQCKIGQKTYKICKVPGN